MKQAIEYVLANWKEVVAGVICIVLLTTGFHIQARIIARDR